MDTKTLLQASSEKYKRANVSLMRFLSENAFLKQAPIAAEKMPFSVFRGIMYSFLQNHGLLISVTPYDLSGKRKWSYAIYFEGNEICKNGFKERELAEWAAFEKSLQYYDTKLFIQDVKDRFYDSKASSSPCNINWEHLDRVLAYKRVNVVSQ
jgi:hypothetical protein